MKIYTRYSPPPSVSVLIDPKLPTMAKQEFAREADVNTIMGRYLKTGTLPVTDDRRAQYGDFLNYDFREIQNTVARGRQEFELLPSEVRNRFNNDPAAYFDHVANADENELRKLGILPPKSKTATATPTPASTPTASPAVAPAPVSGVSPAVSPAVS